MKRMDDLIQAATYRLRPDAELQAEIARELRAHLEDAVAAARADGKDEAQAEEAAVKAFGDPAEVAEKLWQANRSRMRLRAMAKWAGRLVLMPAGILLAVWLCAATLELAGVLIVSSELSGDWSGSKFFLPFLPNSLTDSLLHRPEARKSLSQDERLALEANSNLENWDRLILRCPDKPVYRARHYAIFAARALQDEEPLLPSHRDLFERAVTLLDAGEKTDPDNAFWNYMRADLLMYRSGAAKQEEDFTFTFKRAASGNESATGHGERLVLADRSMFEQGLAEYRKGLTKSFYKSYATEFLDESLALRKSPATLLDELCLVEESAGILLPDLARLRNMSRGIMAYAALLIQERRPQEAEELIRTAPVPGDQLGANSRNLIELLVANAVRQIALRQGATLYDRLGQHDLAVQALALARKESQQEGSFLRKTAPTSEEAQFVAERSGPLVSLLPFGASVTDPAIVIEAQQVERFMAERVALAALALFYLIVIAWLGAWTAWSLWRHRRDTRGPKIYFIGWKRLAWIALVAPALPLLAYAIWTRAFAFGSAHYGITYKTDQVIRVALEMAGTVLLIFGLSLALGWRAARKRCREAGLTDRTEFRWSVRRSLLPVLVMCFLLVGITSQAYLRYGESSAIKALSQPGRELFLGEMEYVTWKDYRAYLRALPDCGALQAEAIRR